MFKARKKKWKVPVGRYQDFCGWLYLGAKLLNIDKIHDRNSNSITDFSFHNKIVWFGMLRITKYRSLLPTVNNSVTCTVGLTGINNLGNKEWVTVMT